jgi:hypothetical protein
LNETATLDGLEETTKFDWRCALNFWAHWSNIVLKVTGVIMTFIVFGSAILNGGRSMMDFNAFGEMWLEFSIFSILLVLAIYHELRISSRRRALVIGGACVACATALLLAIQPLIGEMVP